MLGDTGTMLSIRLPVFQSVLLAMQCGKDIDPL